MLISAVVPAVCLSSGIIAECGAGSKDQTRRKLHVSITHQVLFRERAQDRLQFLDPLAREGQFIAREGQFIVH